MKYLVKLSVLFVFVALTACGGKDSPRGFSLPEGDASAGKATFVALGCNACHSTPDVAQLEGAAVGGISVALGGSVSQVKTYADLVTSVINPSHRISKSYLGEQVQLNGESRMRNYNDVMTVKQLTDLVTYLQPHYTLRVYHRTVYTGYSYPQK